MIIQLLRRESLGFLCLSLILFSAGCTGQIADQELPKEEKNRDQITVMATTTIVADIVKEVGGELIDLQVLVPPSTDPHVYEVTPRDIAALDDADLIFINGLGLEMLLEPVLEDSRTADKVVSVSDRVNYLSSKVTPEGNDQGDKPDPHVWFDPQRVATWVDNVENALSQVDPENAGIYQRNAENYRQSLVELDQWILEEIDQIPASRRLIVTDHDSLGYLVDRYGLELIGTVVPGYNTQAEPTAKELAALIDAIGRHDVAVVFVSDSVNIKIAEQIARDTGIQLVPISTGSLTDASGAAPTYIDFMRLTVETISDALLPVP